MFGRNKKRKRRSKGLNVWVIGIMFILAFCIPMFGGIYLENNYIGNLQDWLEDIGVSGQADDSYELEKHPEHESPGTTDPVINFNN
jgi:hypothetical protein